MVKGRFLFSVLMFFLIVTSPTMAARGIPTNAKPVPQKPKSIGFDMGNTEKKKKPKKKTKRGSSSSSASEEEKPQPKQGRKRGRPRKVVVEPKTTEEEEEEEVVETKKPRTEGSEEEKETNSSAAAGQTSPLGGSEVCRGPGLLRFQRISNSYESGLV
ncbi:hypothetical protein QJS04_geneDACA017836 [Acorus gramineus]|uniref:Uncharacterized protein n=1 Tax=Acorus gramineus TaxID=55184 RepID=A0AAV9AMF7_ACOGR|nr:hypothetical protein QJS04_geneDACA017836 [Acorus gramineus]